MTSPSPEKRSPEDEAPPARFIDCIRDHNRRVLFLAAATAVASAAVWGLLFFAARWLTILAVTISEGTEAVAPRNDLAVFIATGAFLLLLATIVGLRWVDQRPVDQKRGWEHAVDFLLAVPRMTLSIGGTLGAYRMLRSTEVVAAWRFLVHLSEAGEVPAQEVPVELPAKHARHRILMTLQITGLIELRSTPEESSYRCTETGHTLVSGSGPRLRLKIPRRGMLPPR